MRISRQILAWTSCLALCLALAPLVARAQSRITTGPQGGYNSGEGPAQGKTAVQISGGATALDRFSLAVPTIVLTGGLTSNDTITLPQNLSGSWTFVNEATGAFTVSVQVQGSASPVTLPQGQSQRVTSDGANTASSGEAPFPGGNTSPHVATNAALAAASTATYQGGVWRDDYASGIGAPPLWWLTETGTCAANNRVVDGGSCQNEASGNSFYAVPGTAEDVREWGAQVNNSSFDSAPALRSAAAYSAASGAKIVFPASGNVYVSTLDPSGLGVVVAGIPAVTATSASASSGATSLTLSSVSGISNNTPIGVLTSNGYVFTTTVSGAPSGNTITLAAALPGNVNSAAAVWVYSVAAYPTFTFEGTQPLTNAAVCGNAAPYIKLNAAVNRPVIYVEPSVASPVLNNICVDGDRAQQTGWSGGAGNSGLLETVEIADGTAGAESSIALNNAAITGGYNGDFYLGAGRGTPWWLNPWFLYSGQTTSDYAVFFNGYDASGANLSIGENTGHGVLFSEGSQYQFLNGAIFQNGADAVQIGGGHVLYLDWTNVNIQQNGCNGIKELNIATFGGQTSIGHTFTDTTFDGNSKTTTNTCSDVVNVSSNSLLNLIAPKFVGSALNGNIPKYNVSNTSTGFVKLTAPQFSATSAGTAWADFPALVNCANCQITNSWTPAVSGTTTAGTAAYSSRDGWYTLNNGIVTAGFSLQTSSFSGATGGMQIGGLPYVNNASGHAGSCSFTFTLGVTYDTNYSQLSAIITGTGASTALLYESGPTVNSQANPVGHFASATILWGVCTYSKN